MSCQVFKHIHHLLWIIFYVSQHNSPTIFCTHTYHFLCINVQTPWHISECMWSSNIPGVILPVCTKYLTLTLAPIPTRNVPRNEHHQWTWQETIGDRLKDETKKGWRGTDIFTNILYALLKDCNICYCNMSNIFGSGRRSILERTKLELMKWNNSSVKAYWFV